MFEIRADRRPQGRKKLIAERRAFFAFMNEGMTCTAAARAVGVRKKTGRRWLVEFRSIQAGSIAREERSIRLASCRYLEENDRIVIADLLREGRSLREIARALHCSASTISREVRRNRHPGYGGDRPHAGPHRAERRPPPPQAPQNAS